MLKTIGGRGGLPVCASLSAEVYPTFDRRMNKIAKEHGIDSKDFKDNYMRLRVSRGKPIHRKVSR